MNIMIILTIINQFDISWRRDENVLPFYVTMDDILAVEINKGLQTQKQKKNIKIEFLDS